MNGKTRQPYTAQQRSNIRLIQIAWRMHNYKHGINTWMCLCCRRKYKITIEEWHVLEKFRQLKLKLSAYNLQLSTDFVQACCPKCGCNIKWNDTRHLENGKVGMNVTLKNGLVAQIKAIESNGTGNDMYSWVEFVYMCEFPNGKSRLVESYEIY